MPIGVLVLLLAGLGLGAQATTAATLRVAGDGRSDPSPGELHSTFPLGRPLIVTKPPPVNRVVEKPAPVEVPASGSALALSPALLASVAALLTLVFWLLRTVAPPLSSRQVHGLAWAGSSYSRGARHGMASLWMWRAPVVKASARQTRAEGRRVDLTETSGAAELESLAETLGARERQIAAGENELWAARQELARRVAGVDQRQASVDAQDAALAEQLRAIDEQERATQLRVESLGQQAAELTEEARLREREQRVGVREQSSARIDARAEELRRHEAQIESAARALDEREQQGAYATQRRREVEQKLEKQQAQLVEQAAELARTARQLKERERQLAAHELAAEELDQRAAARTSRSARRSSTRRRLSWTRPPMRFTGVHRRSQSWNSVSQHVTTNSCSGPRRSITGRPSWSRPRERTTSAPDSFPISSNGRHAPSLTSTCSSSRWPSAIRWSSRSGRCLVAGPR